MNREVTREEQMKRLEEAQNLPHATLEDLQSIPKAISEQKLIEYLKDFAKPTGACWSCEEPLYIQWGLQHGVAHCSNCGMAARVYHFPENDSGEEIRFERTLQYHPKNFSVSE